MSPGVRKGDKPLSVVNSSLALSASNSGAGSQSRPEMAKLPHCETAALQESPDLVTWKVCPALLYHQTGHRIIHFHYSIWKHSGNLRQKDPYQAIWAFQRFPCCYIAKLVFTILLKKKIFIKHSQCIPTATVIANSKYLLCLEL